MFSTSGGVQYIGRYHDACGEISAQAEKVEWSPAKGRPASGSQRFSALQEFLFCKPATVVRFQFSITALFVPSTSTREESYKHSSNKIDDGTP